MTRDPRLLRLSLSLGLTLCLAGGLLATPPVQAEAPAKSDAKAQTAKDDAANKKPAQEKHKATKAQAEPSKATKAKAEPSQSDKKSKPLLDGPATKQEKGVNQKQLDGKPRRYGNASQLALNSLDLSDAQKKQIQDIQVDGRAQRLTWQRQTNLEMADLRKQLREAQEAKDTARTKEVQDKIRTLNATAPKAADTEKRLLEVLTPQQLEAYQAKMQELRPKRQPASKKEAAKPAQDKKDTGKKDAGKKDAAPSGKAEPKGKDVKAKPAANAKDTAPKQTDKHHADKKASDKNDKNDKKAKAKQD